MKLSDKTQHQLDAEYRNNTEAVQMHAAWIDAHQAYADEFGGMALCYASIGEIRAWVQVVDASEYQVSRPVRLIAGKPVYVVSYQGFELNVVEK